MTTPATYAEWAAEADPHCGICRGMGYARFRKQDQMSVGEMVVRGLTPTSETYESRCPCAKGDPTP